MKSNIIVKPLMTEKASNLLSTNVYTFEVSEDANKNQIAEILETMYKVKVARVRISKKAGKLKRVGKRGLMKQQPDKKVAYVLVREGKIDIFPQA